MDIIAPVTDYVRASLLTTQGDLVKHDGADVARFGIGNAGQILRVYGTPSNLVYQNPGLPMFEYEYSAKNTGVITILSSATTVLTLDLTDVYLNGRFGIYVMVIGIKGGTAGYTNIRVMKDSGSATVQFFHDHNQLQTAQYTSIASSGHFTLACMCRITGTGNLVLKLDGWSEGSDFTVNANNGQLYTHRMKAS